MKLGNFGKLDVLQKGSFIFYLFWGFRLSSCGDEPSETWKVDSTVSLMQTN